jgi:hypothetical protein
MNPMGGTGTSATLGSAGPTTVHRDFSGAPVSNTWYNGALANHLQGSDLNAANEEISAQFNSDVDDATVFGGIDWYYGTDGFPGSDFDFVSVVLHEVGHGLNFIDLMGTDGSWSSYPGIYDRMLEIGDGTDLTAMTQTARASAVISDDLWWNGPGGLAGNGGSIRPKMYAPTTYKAGSSVSHLDETVHGDELMSPYATSTEHSPSAIEQGMLDDMGWTVPSSPTASLLFGSNVGAVIPVPLENLAFMSYGHSSGLARVTPDIGAGGEATLRPRKSCALAVASTYGSFIARTALDASVWQEPVLPRYSFAGLAALTVDTVFEEAVSRPLERDTTVASNDTLGPYTLWKSQTNSSEDDEDEDEINRITVPSLALLQNPSLERA